MIQIHPKIRELFDTLLLQKKHSEKHHPDYRKWLRYYLDFCSKYHHDDLKKETLPHFIKKLRNKKQTITQQMEDLGPSDLKLPSLTQCNITYIVQYESIIDGLDTFYVNLFDKILNRKGVPKNTTGM